MVANLLVGATFFTVVVGCAATADADGGANFPRASETEQTERQRGESTDNVASTTETVETFRETTTALPERVQLRPLGNGDERLFPLGEPSMVTAVFSNAREADSEQRKELYGTTGGDAMVANVSLAVSGEQVDLGEVLIPIEIPDEYLARNAGNEKVSVNRASLAEVSFVPEGTPAQAICYDQQTGDPIGGWRYSGAEGKVDLFVTAGITDDAEFYDIGIMVQWESSAKRDTFAGVDTEKYTNDWCDNEMSTITQWGWGAWIE